MKYASYILLLLTLSSSPYAGPSCNWVQSSFEIKPVTEDTQIELSRYKCVIPNWDVVNEPDLFSAVGINKDKSRVMINKSNDKYQDIEIVKTPKSLSLQSVNYSSSSVSNINSGLSIYDYNWSLLASINNPINEYQANNRQGSEYKIVGFFKIDTNWYIENIRSIDGDCNACTQSVVDTYLVTSNRIQKIDTRQWNISTYKRFTPKQQLKEKNK